MPTSRSRTQVKPKVERRSRGPGTPSYRLYKVSGQAVVTLSGSDVYLGRHGSPESRQRYDEAVAAWLGRGRAPAEPEPTRLSVNELLLAYLEWAEGYYRDHDGKPKAGELYHIRRALRPLREAFGSTAAADFGPRKLAVVRDRFVQEDLSRGMVNRYVRRIKHAFKLGVAKELIPAATWNTLGAFENLKRGHTAARETQPIRPVPDHLVDAVRPFVSRQV